MEKFTVIDLKAEAKRRGLRGYSKLRKAELIYLLTQSTQRGERPKGEVIFVEEPEVIFVEEPKQSLKNKKKREREVRRAEKKSRKAEKRQREAEKKSRNAKKNRKKRESKKRQKSKKEKAKPKLEDDVDIDKLVKDIEESEALKRKRSVETLNDKRRLDNIRSQTFKIIETDSAFNKFVKQYKIEEVKNEEEKKETIRILEKQIKRLKKKKRKTKDGKRKRTFQKVIDGKAKERHRPLKEVYEPKRFLSAVKPTILTFLTENSDIKIQLVLKCKMSRTDLVTGEVEYTDAYFGSHYEINFQGVDVSNLYKTMTDKMLKSFAEYQQNGSNWVFDSIEELQLNTIKYEPLSGSSYIPLPKALANKKAIINMKNTDHQCFKWCVTRALNPVDKDSERITKILRLQAEKLNWKGLNFPMELTQIARFEKLNEVSVNVYGYNQNEIYPLRVSTRTSDYSHQINLLFISEGEKKHYCLIKNMSRLLASQVSTRKAKKFFCPRCLNSFGRQDLLDKHLELCGDNEAVRIKMPEEGTFLQFKNNHKRMDIPFVIYADFESIMRKLRTVQRNLEKNPTTYGPYTEKKILHIPVSFCYDVMCSFDDKFSKVVEFTALSNEDDVAQKFADSLEQEVRSIYKSHPKKEMIFTKATNAIYKKYKTCWMCDGEFTDKDPKVRDHCHYTGKFRGAAHNSCNIKYRRPKFTPVIFHNLSGYDAHLFIKKLSSTKGNIDCIPNNEEKYISFTKHVEVDRFTPRGEEKEVIVTRELRFIDSMKFMNSSLDKLACNLAGLNDMRCKESQCENKEMVFLDIDIKYVAHFKCKKCGRKEKRMLNKKEIQKKFRNTYNHYINNDKHFRLLLRKGVYPYEWLDSLERLNETQLPSKDAFYSNLSGEGISDEDYMHAQNVWSTFNMKTMRDYHNLYNKTDVLLLADVFENFRKVCKENYDLDPCWYYTAPGLAWDACLKLTKSKLELLTDPDMLLMFEKGVRGGVSMISNRHGQANNKYMKDEFDETKPSKYIVYLNANNLYGYAMSKKLPIGGFKWMTEEEVKDWKNHPCILEVDLEYPKELHDLHNDYPLAPERLKINKVEKLIPNLNDKQRYVLHYESLKQYESLGLKITKIHRGIKFKESDWMKQYIDLNTNLRAKAKNDFEKDFFKLMNNSVYGKTIENLRKRVDISFVNTEKKAKKLVAKPNFKKCTIFSENFCAIEMRKTQIYFNKPVYLGMCILDLSKTLMYDFHYNYIRSKYNERAKLLFTDTDSLAYEIQTKDFYKDISPDVEAKFDTSNFEPSHPSGILTGKNKKVIGMFKDEAGGKIIEEFVGLRAKLYSYKMFKSKKENKKCKGVKEAVVKSKISFNDYKRCLFSGNKLYRQMNVFRSRKHEIFTEEINKVALSADDDKRIILPDKVNTLAYGHALACNVSEKV